MLILTVNNISKNFGYGTLFEKLSFSLNEGEKISIVGPNGCGKSTLLKMIAGTERIDGGMIAISRDANTAFLEQTSPDDFDNRIVKEVLNDAFSDLLNLQSTIDLTLQELTSTELETEKYDILTKRYYRLLEQFEKDGGYEIDNKIAFVCSGLKISNEMLNNYYNNLSGGEKTIVHLAKALLNKPKLFLLDEPTNHLDIKRIEWLENYIKSFNGAMVIVSHDRYFLDKVSNKILEIDNGEATIFSTNYSGYLVEKESIFEKKMAEYKDQQKLIKRMEEQIKFFAEKGMAYNSSTLCDRAHALQTQLDRIKSKAIARPKKQRNLNMDFNESDKSGKVVIETKNLTISSPEKNILSNINVQIRRGERVVIIGDNGSGKSTFIKTILGEQPLSYSGEVFVGPSVKIGYLPQIIQFAKSTQNVLEYFQYETALNEQNARSTLATFQFYKEDVNKRIDNLSGGERIRLRLAILIQQQVNTLIFDEPTNHIDIPTKEVLEQSLEDFSGTLIFISHDRYFINKFADRIIEFENGKVNNYLGNYEDYKISKNKG